MQKYRIGVRISFMFQKDYFVSVEADNEQAALDNAMNIVNDNLSEEKTFQDLKSLDGWGKTEKRKHAILRHDDDVLKDKLDQCQVNQKIMICNTPLQHQKNNDRMRDCWNINSVPNIEKQ